MASSNRAALINKVIKVARRHFKPEETQQDRSLLEHLLYACCLENSLPEEADKVFEALSQGYYDWNEVRVTSIRELTLVMKPLNDPLQSAKRLKRVLQSLFETHYSFDLDPLKKQNIGQTTKQFEKYNGTTAFTVAYVTQNSLSGHSIPANQGLVEAMRVVGVISETEAEKGRIPGLERAIPKNKGVEIGSLLHQLGVELYRSPYGPTIRKLLLDVDPDCKSRLPKRANRKAEQEARAAKEAAEAKAKVRAAAEAKAAIAAEAKAKILAEAAKKKSTTSASASSPKKKLAKSPAKQVAPNTSKKKPAKKKSVPKKSVKKKKNAPKSAAKKGAKKKTVAKKKKTTTKKLAKRKPR